MCEFGRSRNAMMGEFGTQRIELEYALCEEESAATHGDDCREH